MIEKKKWIRTELNKADSEALKVELRKRGIYFESSQIGEDFYHLEVECSITEQWELNEWIDKNL